MAKAPNPLAGKAKKLFEKGILLAEIAKKLEVPASTVRRWKSEGKWDLERSDNEQITNAKTTNVRKPRGGQLGNNNAMGNDGGAPEGNINALKHGFYWDVFTGEEQEFFDTQPDWTEVQRLEHALILWEAKIRRLIREIQKIRKNDSELIVHTISKDDKGTETTTVNTFEYIRQLEHLLESAQRGYSKDIAVLNRIRINQKLNALASGNDKMEDILFYIPTNRRDPK